MVQTTYPIILPSRKQAQVPTEAIRVPKSIAELSELLPARKAKKPKFSWTSNGVVLRAKFRGGLLRGWIEVLAEKHQATISVGQLDPTALSYTDANVVSLYGEVIAAAALPEPFELGQLGEAVLASATPATQEQLRGLIDAHGKLHRGLAKAAPTMELIKRFGSARLDLDVAVSLKPDDTARAMINAKRMWPTATCRGAMYRLCGKSDQFDQAWEAISQQRGISELAALLDLGSTKLAAAANEVAAHASLRMLRELCADPISGASRLRAYPAAGDGAFNVCLRVEPTALRAAADADGLHTMGVEEIEHDLKQDYAAAAVRIFHGFLADIDAGVAIDPEKTDLLLRCSPPALRIMLIKVALRHSEAAGVVESFTRQAALLNAE